jgi:hypothetical protein
MKKGTIWLAICLFSTLLIGLALAAGADKGPEVIKIDVNQAKKAVKAFPHHKHQEMEGLKGKCNKCHHTAKQGEKPKKCGSCHTHPKDKDPKSGATGFKKAFHKNCQACHKKQKDRPELKKCKNCHSKK